MVVFGNVSNGYVGVVLGFSVFFVSVWVEGRAYGCFLNRVLYLVKVVNV